jgi:flagellar motor component MotA
MYSILSEKDFIEKFKFYAKLFMDCIELVRREGILSLESKIESLNMNQRDPIRVGLQAAIDGTEPEEIRELLENMMWVNCPECKFCKIIWKMIISSIVDMQNGIHPLWLERKIMSYFPYYLKLED